MSEEMDFSNDVDGNPTEEFDDEQVGGFENDIDINDDFPNAGGGGGGGIKRGGGRGGFRGGRGRPWPGPPPGGPPRGDGMRFRGRGGFGGPPPGGPPFRGRGGGPPMFNRGGGGPPPRNGPPGGFPPPGGYPPNWGGMDNGFGGGGGYNGPPGGMGGGGPPPGGQGGPPFQQAVDANSEMWVETKTAEGKAYYYQARTRETTWTKPEGPNIKVITQDEIEAMAQQQAAHVPQNTSTAAQAALAQANVTNKPDNEEVEGKDLNGPGGMVPGGMMSGPPPGMPFGGPPGQFGGPPFGMPPPGFQGGWPPGGGQQPPQAAPWMPPGGTPTPWGTVTPGGLFSGAMAAIDEAAVMSKVDPDIIARATEWTEHKAPDGRFYYYHAKKGESVWEKPQPLKDLEAAKLAASQGISTRPSLAALDTTGKGLLPLSLNGDAPLLAAAAANVVPKEDKDVLMLSGDDKIKKLQEEIKKKKEEEEKAKELKAQDKSKPISSTPVPGTPWCVVWTGDGRVFFYNPSTRTSVWERPDELVKRTDVDKWTEKPPENAGAPVNLDKPEGGGGKSPPKGGGSSGKRGSDDSGSDSDDETPAKKAKKDDNAALSSSSNGGQPRGEPQPAGAAAKKIDIGKEAAIEAEVRAAKERAVIPLDTRIKLFKEMLAEKQVSAFSTWEKELHKIVFDSRYLLLTSKERKQVFERYVKERAEEERREKRNKLREKKDAFRKLLSDSHLHGKSSFSDFAQKYAKDERFKGVEKMRERESLFNEYLIDVRKKEKEEKSQKREQVRKDFFAMLREHSDIDRHSHWSDVKRKIDGDGRYKAVDSTGQKEEWFREYCKMLKEERKRAKEKEREHKRERDKHKSKNKDRHRDKTGEEKEEKQLRETVEAENPDNPEEQQGGGKEPEDAGGVIEVTDDEKAQEQKDKERQARAEASMREREKEVQRTLATHMRDRDKEREHHKRDEAIQHFNALLADLVRNPELNWREVKRILRKDHRWDLADSLGKEDREKLFNDHLEQLVRKKREKFRELLDETVEVTLVSGWKDIKKVIREDPRYTKFASSERCEREFKDYLKDKLMTAKGQFKELLQETKLITHRSLATLRENQNHMTEIEDILKNDKRYLVLDHIPQERTQLVLNYLEELDRRGPPPPPTASEPNRRSAK